MNNNEYTREYCGYFFTYSDNTISMFKTNTCTIPIWRTLTSGIKSEKDFEVEIMWMLNRYDSSNYGTSL